MRFPAKITSSCIWVAYLIELFNIGMPVVRTDGRVYGHVITKFLPMLFRFARESSAINNFSSERVDSKGLYGRWRLLPRVPIGPTSPHSPNQQIHSYKNSNVNKSCVADIRFFRSVEIWRLFLFDSPFSHCPYAPTIFFSSLPHPPPPYPRWNSKQRSWWTRCIKGNVTMVNVFSKGIFSLFKSRNLLTRGWMEGS